MLMLLLAVLVFLLAVLTGLQAAPALVSHQEAVATATTIMQRLVANRTPTPSRTPFPTVTPSPSPTPVPTPVFAEMWEPPQEQPDLSIAAWTYTSTQYLAEFWEPLREAHPERVTREVIGRDASDTYDLYAYIVTPPEYEKTVIITANLHGGETFGQLFLYRLLYHVLNDYEGSEQLTYLHDRVRLVAVPMVDPWGVDYPGRERVNANGVDLNRNFDYLWEAFIEPESGDSTFKGEFPFSEGESQAVRDLLETYSDADVYFDLHAGGPELPHWRAYRPMTDETDGVPLRRVVSALALPEDTIDEYQLPFPMAHNYAAERHGMLTLLPEFAAGKRGGIVYGSEDLYHALRWYGNLIIQYATWR